MLSESRDGVVRLEELDSNLSKAAVKAGGKEIYRCFQCGTCTASCPVRLFDEEYNPRLIIRAAVLGLKEVLSSDLIWLCAACYSCTERCPRGVRPTEIIRVLRNIAVKEGYIHQFYRTQATAIVDNGRIWKEEDFVNEIREDMGLPAVPRVDMGEVTKMLDYTRVKELLDPEKEGSKK
jgi:CoB--CoM heterodisulfide reductase subunit C